LGDFTSAHSIWFWFVFFITRHFYHAALDPQIFFLFGSEKSVMEP
jgi:hypothetical protein